MQATRRDASPDLCETSTVLYTQAAERRFMDSGNEDFVTCRCLHNVASTFLSMSTSPKRFLLEKFIIINIRVNACTSGGGVGGGDQMNRSAMMQLLQSLELCSNEIPTSESNILC
jgi:hypothetical protein